MRAVPITHVGRRFVGRQANAAWNDETRSVTHKMARKPKTSAF